mgnify:FL=1
MADYKPIDYAEYPALFHSFGSYKTVVQNRSVNTVSDYLSDLRLFFRYLRMSRENLPAEQFSKIDISCVDLAYAGSVKKSEIYEFLNFMTEHGKNHAGARARKLSAIKAFYKYLTVATGQLSENPARDIEGPKIKQALPKFLSYEESLSLLQTVQNDTKSKTCLRDYTMITLFLNCGMRLSELVGISLSDIDPALRSMRVVGKGNKERILYLNDACRQSLTLYLQQRQSLQSSKENRKALFLSSRGQRISPKTVQWVVYKYLDAAGFSNRKLSVHKLRHTAATLMYQSGQVDVRVLKEILGHEQLNTTQIYTHVSNEQLQRAMQANPLADAGANPPKKQ